MTEKYDAIVIGAGHNGLVCAALLGKAGKRVLVLEANEGVGGAAVTRPFADGYSVSACAHLLYQLQPEVTKELGLRPRLAADNIDTIVLGDGGAHVRYSADGIKGVGQEDADRYRAFQKRMQRFAGLLQTYLNKAPPRLGTRDRQSLFTLARLGLDLRMLGREHMQEFLRVIGMNIYDELVENFDSPLLKGGLSVDAVLGTHLGPRSPNTILTYLYRLAGNNGRVAVPAGGLGSVSEAIANCARDSGVTIRTGMPVSRILVDNGRVAGVETESGEQFPSLTVVSNADPKRTIMELVGARHFETRFTHRAHHIRMRGNAAKLHLALDGLPTFEGLDKKDYAERMLVAPDENYVERSFNPAKYGETSPEPVMEIVFPSFRDESLAPTGKHVLSAVVQYAPYRLKGGWTDAAREAFRQTAIRTIARYAPDIEQRIVASEMLTPADIEREFHMTGGHWHHGELTLDQFMFVRPVAGAAQYQLPLDGLFLCGAGAHPGGGVSGAPGRNAAKAILAREKAS
ncbi:MAG: NAD(P)/FAD-dependent oxidoreductase [Gammaproteobacteria bacterium]|nr:NAD(P)/FAD-dependent oxidoreductase [Gammaproteobacteria bacterium]MDH4255333.1 NAD(P)/FAD-dependent oxidoreductase [Gammaproteobacteria bacterium]MDH5310656.1 NAD(P)/FAD-dependent oxidoreductase [Gammaproteobacteria bacterium]